MRPLLLPTVATLALLGGCGGKASAPETKGSSNPAPVTDTPSKTDADAGPVATAPKAVLTESDCEGLLNHIFKVVYEHKIATVPEDQRPSPEDVLVAKDRLRKELFQQCVGADRETAGYSCAMSAQSPEDLGACQGAPSGG